MRAVVLVLMLVGVGCGDPADDGTTAEDTSSGDSAGVDVDASVGVDVDTSVGADVDASVGVDVDASIGDADTLSDVDANACCPISEYPSCSSFQIGGSNDRPGGCPVIEDAQPVGWSLGEDENGCPIWTGGNNLSCLPWPNEDVMDARDGDAPSDPDTEASEVDDDDSEIVEPVGVDPIFGYAGSIRMIEQVGEESGALVDTYVLVDLRTKPPIPYLELKDEIGDCRLYDLPDQGCPPCPQGYRCASDGNCQSEPAFASIGDITFSGLSAALTAEVSGPRYQVTPEPPNDNLFADHATITVASASGPFSPAIALEGVSDLSITGGSVVQLYDIADKEIAWTPDGDDARVDVTLQLGWHGAPPTSILFCSAPDAAGKVVVSKDLIKGFDYFGGGLFQVLSYAERVRRKAVHGAYGPVELVAISRVMLFVGHASAPED